MKAEPFGRNPRLTSHARTILDRRYLRRDAENNVVETPAQMFRRVAGVVAQAEALYGSQSAVNKAAEAFYEIMASLDFLPNSPTLMNAGRDLGQLSACFVLPVEDSIESIFNAVRDTALIHKSGGGTGFSFSAIRPARDMVKSTLGISSGPLSFMNVFDVATETIKQGGTRRGANMGLLSVHHPDILEFISVKAEQPGRFTNFNFSVSATDRFMEAVEAGKSYELVNPHTGLRQGRLQARDVFERLVQAAWTCGDPGLVFIDRINGANPLPKLGRIEATNPCGEQPLLPYESCNLGSLNLSRFVKGRDMDWSRLKTVISLAVRFLDNVVDINRYPLPQIREMTQGNRKIGLGVMGLADALIRLGLPYDSEPGLNLCGRIMDFVQRQARSASAELARKRGNFPNFEASIYPAQGRKHMRNATTTTIAPTGTISLIANCSSGIEPLFALAYSRRLLDNQEFIEVNTAFKRAAQAKGFWSASLAEELARTGTIKETALVPEDLRRLFVTAHDVSPLWHLRVQAAFQGRTDNAVSKTVNLPHGSPPETVREIFLQAYRMKLKGVTVYRDRSRSGQVISLGHTPAPARGRAAACPECGGTMEDDNGCTFCRDCGFSHCS